MATQFSLNSEYTGYGTLTLDFPHQPNADTAFIYGEQPMPPPVQNAEDLSASYEWFGDVLIRAGMLHRWQDIDLADQKLNHGPFPPEGVKERQRHSPYIMSFENEEGLIDPTDLAEARRLREAQNMMTLGVLYCRLSEGIRVFTEGEGVERDVTDKDGFWKSHVFTRTLEPSEQPMRVYNIGNWSRPVTSAMLSFSPGSSDTFVTLHGREDVRGGREGIQKQIVVNTSWTRTEDRMHPKPPAAPHPIKIAVHAEDFTYRNPSRPAYSLNLTPAVVGRVATILRRMPALQERIKTEGAQG